MRQIAWVAFGKGLYCRRLQQARETHGQLEAADLQRWRLTEDFRGSRPYVIRDSHLVAQVKAMLENPGQLEQELKVVREVAGLVELALQQAGGEAGYRGCSPAAQCVRLRFAGEGSWTFWSCRVCWMGFQS